MYLFLLLYYQIKLNFKRISATSTYVFFIAYACMFFYSMSSSADNSLAVNKSFVIEDIKIEGIKRISSGTLFNALNIKVHDKINEDSLNLAAKNLFDLGFFNDIKFYQQGHTLVIVVDERPLINNVTIKQNRFVSTESMLDTLKTLGLSEGDIFQRFALDTIKYSLENMYMEQGRYGSKIIVETKPLPGNQINISITTKESDIAKVENVSLIGNKKIASSELLENLEIGKHPWYMFFSRKGLYWRERLAGDISRIRSYYLDRGYFNLDINYVNVRFTPDKKSVFISTGIHEGEPYKIGSVKLAGDLIIPEQEAASLVTVKSGQLYSQKDITTTEKQLKNRLGELGYFFVTVEAIPKINSDKHILDLTFYVSPGAKTYVRRINFSGNIITEDKVMRREMRQVEGAVANTSRIERSKQRLQLLDLFADVKETIVKVPGTDNQIDINYTVKEKSTGEVSFSVAYSQPDGMTIGAAVSEHNFLGTGKTIAFDASKNESTTAFSLGYRNPYFTDSGISQSWDVHYKKHDFAKSEVSSYQTNSWGIGNSISYPLTEYQRVYLGLSYTDMEVRLNNDISKLIKDYVDEHAPNKKFRLPKGNIKWIRSTIDNNMLPTAGSKQELSFVTTLLPSSTAKFYKVGFSTDSYTPIANDFIFRTTFKCGYMGSYNRDKDDNGHYNHPPPFFEQYYVGGLGSVRGFKPSSIGPDAWNKDIKKLDQDDIRKKYKDGTLKPGDVTGKVRNFGGNSFAYGSFELLLPIPFASQKKSMRCSLFFDYGLNVNSFYNDEELAHSNSWEWSGIKYSAGVCLFWLTPIGAITLSYAYPFNAGPFDSKNKFQITLGEKFF